MDGVRSPSPGTPIAMPARAPASPSTVLVTGASSGIGEALAHCFARAGHRLVLVARREARLRALAKALRDEHGARVDVMPADLAQPGAAAVLAASLRRRRRSIDVLVNNAGVLEQGAFIGMGAQRCQQLIDLNVAGLTAMLAAFVPAMVGRGHGRVLNVASVSAFTPVPGLATYAASKAYVLSLTESLAEELRGTGVTVTALCPGITATAMLERASRDNCARRATAGVPGRRRPRSGGRGLPRVHGGRGHHGAGHRSTRRPPWPGVRAEVAAAPHGRRARSADPVSAGSRAATPAVGVRARPLRRQVAQTSR